MRYKTVLVHVDESARASERIKISAAIAMAQNAHLIGTAMTGASRFLVQTRMLAELDPNLRTHLEFLRQRAKHGLVDFENAVQKLGLASFEKRLVNDEAGGGICLHARYADLVVIGQNDPHEMSPVVMPDFPEYVILHCGRPVLVIPFAGRFDNLGRQILVAWDGSLEAMHAISNAMPLLSCANRITVVTLHPCGDGGQSQVQGHSPANEIMQYLARHDLKVEVLQRSIQADIGEALLSLAAERDVDLLVMGAYGHMRFREIVLGGVTRKVLSKTALPVLMSL